MFCDNTTPISLLNDLYPHLRTLWGREDIGGGTGGKAPFLYPHVLRVCHCPKLHVFSHRPCAVQGSQVFVCYKYFLFFPIPTGTELSLIKIMLFTETDLGGVAFFCLTFKRRRKTLNKYVVAPVPPLLLLWRSPEGWLYLLSTVPWWQVIVQKVCSGNCWTEGCPHTPRCSLLITQLVNIKLVPSEERFATGKWSS